MILFCFNTANVDKYFLNQNFSAVFLKKRLNFIVPQNKTKTPKIFGRKGKKHF